MAIVFRFGKEGYGKRSTVKAYFKEEGLKGGITKPEITHTSNNGECSWLKSFGLTSWMIEN